MAKFGLGKGLAELETEMGQSPEVTALAGIPERVVVRPIPISQIGANPDQPRKTFEKDELDDLAQSIKEHGVLQPIIVRTVMGMPHLYEIVAGERRWRASILAGQDSIPALVKPLTLESAMEIALIENVQRENLNAIEESDAYKNIMDKCNYSMPDLCRLIGKSESYIRNSLRLASLPESVKSMVKSGELSASHARTLAVAENSEELAKKIMTDGLSVAESANLVRIAPRADSTKRAGRKQAFYPSEELQEAEREIERSLGVKVGLSIKSSGAGTIALHFRDKSQMELLLELLKQAKL